jgi:transcriptional regulator with XRE-family HTH domain
MPVSSVAGETETLGRRLALAREHGGLTQAQAAAQLGISRSYVAQIEVGGSLAPHVEVLVRRLIDQTQRSLSELERDNTMLAEFVSRRPGLTETELFRVLGMTRRRFKRALVCAVANERVDRRWATASGHLHAAWRYFSPDAEVPISVQWSGEELKGQRESSCLSKAELGRRVGVTAAAIAKFERDGLPLGRVDRLVAILDPPPDGLQILEAIERAGWSQSEFARRALVSRETVRDWIRGKRITRGRWGTVRQAIRDAWTVEPSVLLSPREALLDLLDNHPKGLRRTELRGWRARYKLGRQGTADEIDRAVNAGQAHWEQDFIDAGDHKRIARRLVRGRTWDGTEGPHLSGPELKHLRENAELSRREAAELLGMDYPTYVNSENGNARVHQTRVTEIRRILEEAASGTTPLDKKVREIVGVVSRHPDISRTELFEGYVGDSKLAHKALDRALDDERVHERIAELVGRQPYRGLRVGPSPEPDGAGSSMTGAALKESREAVGVLQRDLATAIGASTAAVSRWEKHGERIPFRFHRLIEDVLADAERRMPEQVAGKAQAVTDRALAAVVDGVARRPGISTKALLGRLSRPAVREALRLALETGQVHEEWRTVVDTAGRRHMRLGLHGGPGPLVGAPPDPITPREIQSVRRAARLSQGKLGNLVGVSQAVVTGWERGTPVPPGRRNILGQVLKTVRAEKMQTVSARRRLPREDVPSAVQLVADHPGITRGRLLTRASTRRRQRLGEELAESIAIGEVHERRAVVGGRDQIRLYPGPGSP